MQMLHLNKVFKVQMKIEKLKEDHINQIEWDKNYLVIFQVYSKAKILIKNQELINIDQNHKVKFNQEVYLVFQI